VQHALSTAETFWYDHSSRQTTEAMYRAKLPEGIPRERALHNALRPMEEKWNYHLDF
jgi:hypothetical protein